jgi:hypothetical protein
LFFLDRDVALYKDAIENTLKEFEKDTSLGLYAVFIQRPPMFREVGRKIIDPSRTLLVDNFRRLCNGGFLLIGSCKKNQYFKN